MIKVWKTEHDSEMDVCYSCICFSDLGQHFLIYFGESSLPYSQTTMLSVKLILLLGPRGAALGVPSLGPVIGLLMDT